MKKFILVSIISILSVNMFSQKPDEIKSDSRYIWGESTAKTLEDADNFAIKDLVSQISTKVESSFSTTMIETDESLEEFTRSAISTYSNIYLNDAKRLVVEKRKSIYVIRYIDREIVDGIFKNRKQKILDYTNLAVRAEKDLRIADALRYYYWSLALLNSHPERNSIRKTLDDNTDISLITFINSEIDQILQSIDIKIIDTIKLNSAKSFILDVKYKGRDITNLDYTYWTGNSYSGMYSAKNGKAIAEFYNNQSDDFSDLQIKFEYQYLSRSKIDPEVESVMQMTSLPRLKNAEIRIEIKPSKAIASNNTQQELNSIGIRQADEEKVENNRKPKESDYRKSITKVNQAILSKKNDNIIDLFTENGLQCYNKIIKYGNAQMLPQEEPLKIISVNNQTMIRSIPMLFNFPNNNRKFVEDVVYVFDSTGKIDNINFALSDISITDILSKSERFGKEEDKYFLINFLESYQTAYALENLEFIESVFSEDALIIVGTVLKQVEQIEGMYKQLDNQNIRYTRYSKDEYVQHLTKAFNSKEFINISFEQTEVKKAGGDEKIYGIQLAQNYYSSNYSDKGYLFLMIDLNDSINPKIYVRTWQPEKNSDGSVIGLENFSIR
ncbi:MAG: LPP20 family lipoprotein [Bacteroidales bacterium]|nr:LPP20 family lipoprotein [Bacteroidales bacterium]